MESTSHRSCLALAGEYHIAYISQDLCYKHLSSFESHVPFVGNYSNCIKGAHSQLSMLSYQMKEFCHPLYLVSFIRGVFVVPLRISIFIIRKFTNNLQKEKGMQLM